MVCNIDLACACVSEQSPYYGLAALAAYWEKIMGY